MSLSCNKLVIYAQIVANKSYLMRFSCLFQQAVVMREELDAFIGAAWGECNPKRKGYRNGSYMRELATATGSLEDLKVPRDREGQFHSRVFERYSRYEPHIARSASPRCLWQEQVPIKWEKWLKPCWESHPVPTRCATSCISHQLRNELMEELILIL